MCRVKLLVSLAVLLAGLLAVEPTPARAAIPPNPARAAIPPTVLPNGSFENGPSGPGAVPEGWTPYTFQPSATLTWDADVALVGRRSVAISAPSPNDARWIATVPVQPGKFYLLSGWIKTEGVAHSAQSVDIGAHLNVMGTWNHTPGIFGTTDWTYVSMVFGAGAGTQVEVAARLGFWSGTTTGKAWFDGLRVTLLEAGGPIPNWNILVLIYDTTDVLFNDSRGVTRHLVARMSAEDRAKAEREATAFVTQDIPALTSGMMTPSITIRYPNHPLAPPYQLAGGWSPGPADTAVDRDPAFDSVIVIWDPRTTDQQTGEQIWIGNAAGMAWGVGGDQTYEAQIIESVWYGHRNVFKHEWGHSILFYFEAMGTTPLPAVSNHTDAGQYVHCPSGEQYVWVDETDANLIPNSIYHNSSGFTHDYYSGTVATADQPARCLGITRAAWATGGPVSRPDYPYYHQLALSPAAVAQNGLPGDVVRHQLTLTNTGNLTDTFTIRASTAVWPVAAPADSGPVGPGAATQLEVGVSIPRGASGDAADIVTLEIASEADPSQVERAQLTTRVAIRHSLELWPSSTEGNAEPGGAARYTLTLTNTGTVVESVALAAEGAHWPVLLPAELRNLPAGAAVQFPVAVTVPLGAPAGASDVVTVRATLQGGAAAEVRLLTRNAAPAPPPRYFVMLPFVLRSGQ